MASEHSSLQATSSEIAGYDQPLEPRKFGEAQLATLRLGPGVLGFDLEPYRTLTVIAADPTTAYMRAAEVTFFSTQRGYDLGRDVMPTVAAIGIATWHQKY